MFLSNGVEVHEYKEDNGSTVAVIVPDDRAMTEAEWREYVGYLKALSLEQHRERIASRKTRNHAAWEADKRLRA